VHGVDEWVGLASLQRVTEMYTRTLLSYQGQANSYGCDIICNYKALSQQEQDQERSSQSTPLLLPQLQSYETKYLRFYLQVIDLHGILFIESL
jgi:hypothetical protein